MRLEDAQPQELVRIGKSNQTPLPAEKPTLDLTDEGEWVQVCPKHLTPLEVYEGYAPICETCLREDIRDLSLEFVVQSAIDFLLEVKLKGEQLKQGNQLVKDLREVLEDLKKAKVQTCA